SLTRRGLSCFSLGAGLDFESPSSGESSFKLGPFGRGPVFGGSHAPARAVSRRALAAPSLSLDLGLGFEPRPPPRRPRTANDSRRRWRLGVTRLGRNLAARTLRPERGLRSRRRPHDRLRWRRTAGGHVGAVAFRDADLDQSQPGPFPLSAP